MKPDAKAMKQALRQRESELQRLISQMKHDQLHSSSVYKNLEQELDEVKDQLKQPGDTLKK